jgi:hypothetical protein
MQGGTIYGNDTGAGDNANKTIGSRNIGGAALHLDRFEPETSAKWGTGGTYTKGGAAQTGGSDIATTDETLIAIPKR